jgi:hypothetical protein
VLELVLEDREQGRRDRDQIRVAALRRVARIGSRYGDRSEGEINVGLPQRKELATSHARPERCSEERSPFGRKFGEERGDFFGPKSGVDPFRNPSPFSRRHGILADPLASLLRLREHGEQDAAQLVDARCRSICGLDGVEQLVDVRRPDGREGQGAERG